jgi:hypothetical protein
MADVTLQQRLGAVWHKLGSIHLTVVVCLLLAADLTLGYLCLKDRATLFAPMNEIGLAAWSATYGRHNLLHTSWFFLLLGLLTLLCLNTFVCTTNRVTALLRKRTQLGAIRLSFKLAPHLMHYALILMLAGYLGSYVFAKVLDTRTLIPGSVVALPATTARIAFIGLDPLYYPDDRLPAFKNRTMRPRARLLLIDGKSQREVILCVNRPVWFKGYGIFLKQFSPKTKPGSGMALRERVDVSIRKDAGVRLYLVGILLFTIGLGVYLVEWTFLKSKTSGIRTSAQIGSNGVKGMINDRIRGNEL